MIRCGEIREPARLLFHLGEGYSRVLLERTEGLGMADGGVEWDIPTDRIPRHLRRIGARFLVMAEKIQPEDGDDPEDIRAALRVRVEVLGP